MKEYELSILVHPDLEMNPDPALDKVKKLVEVNGGKITKEEPDGKKRLSYTIKGNDFALYYFFDAELPASAPAKISATLGITDEVIRFLIVKSDPRRAKYLAAKAREEESEQDTKTLAPKDSEDSEPKEPKESKESKESEDSKEDN